MHASFCLWPDRTLSVTFCLCSRLHILVVVFTLCVQHQALCCIVFVTVSCNPFPRGWWWDY
jgi:hypothetical protein